MNSQGPAASFAAPVEAPRRSRSWLIPAALFAALVAMLVAVLVIARQANDDGTPPRPGEFLVPAPIFPTVPYDIQQRSAAGNVTVSAADGATFDVNLDAVPVEILEPITISDIAPGQGVNVIARPNAVRNFVVTSIVVLNEGATLLPGDAGYRSPAGFQGWEAGRDQELRPVLAGIVVDASADEFVISTAVGEVTLRLVETGGAAPPAIYRLREDPALQIDAGDRLALAGIEDGDPETAKAALVQPAN
ncbi:MAG: hypothetical protein R3C29_10665 [Dehalococcoidia bacterium]